jgi:hypothetical protein
MSRRKRNALVLGGCALALYLVHFGWFLLFGPPDWFEQVGERSPQMTSVALDSSFDPYLAEAAQPPSAGLAAQGSGRPAGIEGRIVREDRLSGAGPALLQTADEDRERLYVQRTESAPWRALPLPTQGRVGEARWLRAGDRFEVLTVVRRSWWPLGGNYGRFWRALIEAESRPESGLFLLDSEGAGARYLFPGRSPVPSPDRRSVVVLRSERRGFHSLHLWRPGEDEALTVVSLWEAEAGSGPSFHWNWSLDSKVLFVGGRARGSRGSPARSAEPVRLLYDVEGDRLVELK